MSGSADFFIKDKAPEKTVLSLLEKHIHRSIESIEHPNDKADLFLQYLEYSEGFALNAGLAWGADDFELNELQVARALAKELSTDILFQAQHPTLPEDIEWYLAKPEGNVYAVNIVELDDGIDVHPNTSIKLISLEPPKGL
jgi:hypothetical protein